MSFDPALLFFVFGAAAGFIRSNLEIPPQIGRFLSLYLLMSLGLEAGFAMAASGMTSQIATSLAAALAMAFVVPLIGYVLLQGCISRFDAAALAAAYGSVSAVTFVTATQHLEALGVTVGGHMTLAMVLMESPAIIVAVLLANRIRVANVAPAGVVTSGGGSAALGSGGPSISIGKILHESFTDGAHLLLLGAIAVGLLSGEAGKTVMQPFSGDLFKGMLAFFLLDMGLMVARNFREARKASPVLIAYAVAGPLVHAALALGIASALALPVADAALLMVLAASASYIVVPAVLRYAIPEANPSLYFGLSLGVSFPLNILIGIPLYTAMAQSVLG